TPEVSLSSRCASRGRCVASQSRECQRSPLRSVPSLCPQVGWTTRPGGLSTARRYASSSSTRSDCSCATSAGAPAGGRGNSGASRGLQGPLGAAGRPSRSARVAHESSLATSILDTLTNALLSFCRADPLPPRRLLAARRGAEAEPALPVADAGRRGQPAAHGG